MVGSPGEHEVAVGLTEAESQRRLTLIRIIGLRDRIDTRDLSSW